MYTRIDFHPTNFAKVDNFLMRASQPSREELRFLKAKEGLTDVINLSNNAPKKALQNEKDTIKELNLGYTEIPSETDNPTQENIEKFLQKTIELKQKKDSKTLVHCNAGIDRTGTYVVFYQLFNKLKNFNDAIVGMIMQGHEPQFHPNLIPRIRVLAEKMKLVNE